MHHVYIDSTLKSEWNLKFNVLLCMALKSKGIKCYLPQRDTDQTLDRVQKFRKNITAIKQSSHLLAVAVHESPNWGVEVGFVADKKITSIILVQKGHEIPLMADFLADQRLIVDDLENINDYIEQLVGIIK